jgi:hypothetical protein
MSTFGRSWYLCGGWAIDAWLGRQSREHLDVDIAIFHVDQRALFEHLSDWQLIAHDPNVPGDTTEPWDGRVLDLPAHIHASLDQDAVSAWVSNPGARVDTDAFKLEIVIDERSGNDFVLSRQPSLTVPLSQGTRESPWGVPTLMPELLLFYKATAYPDLRPHDELDFEALLPHLDEGRRHWLGEAVSLICPGHVWLPRIIKP